MSPQAHLKNIVTYHKIHSSRLPKPFKKAMTHLAFPWDRNKRKHYKQLAFDWDLRTYASKKLNYVFMGIPKVCSARVKSDLHVLEGFSPAEFGTLQTRPDRLQNCVKSLLDWDYKEIQHMLSSPDWLRFSFVRNPYERLYSGYRSMIASGTPNYDGCRNDILEHSGRKDISANDVPFKDFVDYVCQQDNHDRDVHWKTQESLMLLEFMDYNFIGRYENFDQDYSSILKKFNAPQAMLDKVKVKMNATNAHQTWHKAYTQELADMVFSSYEADFTRFNYDRNSWVQQ